MAVPEKRLQEVVDEVYMKELHRELEDPERLRELYGAPWVDGAWRDRARQIATLAKQMIGAELAEVNLVSDHTMMCIASADGDERDIDANSSYCQYVVATKAAVIIHDAQITRFVQDNPTARTLRSYVGIPLTHRGRVLGALCVADREPRNWTVVEVHLLTQLATTLLSSEGWVA